MANSFESATFDLFNVILDANYHLFDTFNAVEKAKDIIQKNPEVLSTKVPKISTLCHHFADHPNIDGKNHLLTYIKNQSLPIHWVSSLGCTESVKLFLSSYADSCKERDAMGYVPLVYAAQHNHVEISCLLLQYYPPGATIQTKSGIIPLTMALCNVHNQNMESMVRLLVENNPSTVRSKTGPSAQTALHVAVKNNNVNVVRYLCETYPEALSQNDRYGVLPLQYAVIDGEDDVIKYLIEASECKTLFGKQKIQILLYQPSKYPIWKQNRTSPWRMMFTRFNKMEMSSMVLDLWRLDFPILQYAIGNVTLDDFSFIINSIYDDDVKIDYSDPIVIAIHKASMDMDHWDEYYRPLVEMMYIQHIGSFDTFKNERELDATCLADENGQYLLHILALEGLPWRGIKEIVDENIKALASPDKHGMLPFMMAAAGSKSHLNVVYQLLQLQPDVLVRF